MANRRINRMQLPEVLIRKLTSNHVMIVSDLFKKNFLELVDLGFMPDEVKLILDTIAVAVTPKPWTVLEKINSVKSQSLALGPLPIPIGLTELVGGPGLGKTQACLTLAVSAVRQAAMAGQESGRVGGDVVYIDTECTFSPSRLVEIGQVRYADFKSAQAIKQLTERVRVIQVSASHELLRVLQGLQELVIEHGTRLIIVDSVASPVRQDYDKGKMPQRQALLSQVANILKKCAETFSIPVVVTNQTFSGYGQVSKGQSASDSTPLSAALGVSWAHAVNTRFLLQEVGQGRSITVAKSPSLAGSTSPYVITGAGLQVLEPAV